MIVDYIDEHKEEFGVEPICRVLREHGLQIAPSTYRSAKTRPSAARAQRDAVVLERIRAVHSDREIGRGLYGVRKVHAQLGGEGGVAGRPVSRRQVERLLRAEVPQGARRGRVVRTTRPGAAAARPPDLV
ncbi:IS3 family transposase [Geodermatophilus chilensis]|uniref:IS3 family transposase n=1 Tax=Geodermatophilus chilensis TaxID=2035835 RepID=UPI0038CBFCB3